ncbi:MAG: hypothetical protein SFX74_00605 [Fimbriimonadaceae bacterium]|nr:hypothetical protein [Fimbriimonadaceae bacterium]
MISISPSVTSNAATRRTSGISARQAASSDSSARAASLGQMLDVGALVPSNDRMARAMVASAGVMRRNPYGLIRA